MYMNVFLYVHAGLKTPMLNVLDHSDKAEAFRHTMKAYQAMAKARTMARVSESERNSMMSLYLS
jgi:hypothetical protein